MGTDTKRTSTPANEIVSLAQRLAPNELERIRNANPEFVESLTPGLMAGGINEYTRGLAEVTVAAGNALIAKAGPALELLKKRASNSASLRTGSQVIALISTSGVLATIGSYHQAAYIAAAITFLAGLFGLLSERILALIDPAAGNAQTLVTKLSEARSKFEVIIRTLIVVINLPHEADEAAAKELISQANVVSADINTYIDQLPV